MLKCEIYRSSDLFSENKPCKNAYKEDKTYYIDITSLDDILDLIDEVGDVIIQKDHSIEIYDCYRE